MNIVIFPATCLPRLRLAPKAFGWSLLVRCHHGHGGGSGMSCSWKTRWWFQKFFKVYTSRTQMTLVLIEKGLVLEG